MEECPFCGARPFWDEGQVKEFECRTIMSETGLRPNQSKECLERQLAALQAQVAGMMEVIEGLEAAATKVNKERLKPSANLFVWCVKAQAILSTPTAGEWISVRREDLDWLLFLQYGKVLLDSKEVEMYNRLKAALGTGGENKP